MYPHHHELCIGTKPSADGKRWVCPKCRCDMKKGGDNSRTPIRNPDTEEILKGNKKGPLCNKKSPRVDSPPLSNNEVPPPPLPPTPPPASSELQVLTSEIRFLRQDVSVLKEHLAELATSLSRCHARLDEANSHLAQANNRIKTLEEREVEVASLRLQITVLQEHLQSQSQFSLRNELEIVGIPETDNESVGHIALLTAAKVGVTIQDVDIDWTARVGPKRAPDFANKLPRPIVVRFVRRTKRDEVFRAGKSRKNLTTKDFNTGEKEHRIYINERLTKENRWLFREARSRTSEAGFKFCWTRNGFVCVREREGSPAIQLRSQARLDEILGKPANPLAGGGA